MRALLVCCVLGVWWTAPFARTAGNRAAHERNASASAAAIPLRLFASFFE
jgi:hypothetical protein